MHMRMASAGIIPSLPGTCASMIGIFSFHIANVLVKERIDKMGLQGYGENFNGFAYLCVRRLSGFTYCALTMVFRQPANGETVHAVNPA